MTAASEDVPRRPVGRPRSSGATSQGSPREAIIAAATRLFARDGYANTTMSAIAEAAGLRQPSVYYWFKRKEFILQATLAVNRASLDFIVRAASASGSPALKLYRLLRYDTLQLCLSPCDFNEIERLADEQGEAFSHFWRDYQQLQGWVAAMIEAGIDEAQFIECPPRLTAIGLLTFNEGMQKRYRSRELHDPDGTSDFKYPPFEAEELAEFVATTSIRSLLRDPTTLAELQAQAAAFDDYVPSGGT